jgi:hypothetical protein
MKSDTVLHAKKKHMRMAENSNLILMVVRNGNVILVDS